MTKTLAGAKASLKLNGTKVAFVGGVNIDHQNQLTRIDVLDQLTSAELAETGHVASFSVTLFKIDENTANILGLDPRNIDDILTQPDLVMEIYNRIDDTVAYEMTGVKFAGGSGSLDARGVWSGSWNFEGIRGFGI